ncbi:unnamed protein product [Auanema sp. JU1783]|nr:unnamed protein product [Auanema sp. JU1783]
MMMLLLAIDSPASNGQRGVWYSHFDGQYICRQIIQYPSSDPILLIAGKDDVHMCDRPLDQTDLTRRKGAEIPPGEFENVWAHFGGKPLPKWTP